MVVWFDVQEAVRMDFIFVDEEIQAVVLILLQKHVQKKKFWALYQKYPTRSSSLPQKYSFHRDEEFLRCNNISNSLFRRKSAHKLRSVNFGRPINLKNIWSSMLQVSFWQPCIVMSSRIIRSIQLVAVRCYDPVSVLYCLYFSKSPYDDVFFACFVLRGVFSYAPLKKLWSGTIYMTMFNKIFIQSQTQHSELYGHTKYIVVIDSWDLLGDQNLRNINLCAIFHRNYEFDML